MTVGACLLASCIGTMRQAGTDPGDLLIIGAFLALPVASLVLIVLTERRRTGVALFVAWIAFWLLLNCMFRPLE